MEADWEFDIAADASVIDAHWPGRVDLLQDPGAAHRLPEAVHLPALAEALEQLNLPASNVWTSKCDVWSDEPFDPDELDAPAGAASCSLACYIDVLPREAGQWGTPDAVADWCRSICVALQDQPLRQCRADLVIRSAALREGEFGFGVTAYVIACGDSRTDAAGVLSRALDEFAQTVVALSNGSKYNENIAGE